MTNSDYIYTDLTTCYSRKQEHDIEIEVVDNGFLASIEGRKYIFSTIDELDNWIDENFKTPEQAKKNINKIIDEENRKTSGIIPQIPQQPLPSTSPNIWQIPYTWPSITTGDPPPNTTYGNYAGSYTANDIPKYKSESKNTFLSKIFGKKRNENVRL